MGIGLTAKFTCDVCGREIVSDCDISKFYCGSNLIFGGGKSGWNRQYSYNSDTEFVADFYLPTSNGHVCVGDMTFICDKCIKKLGELDQIRRDKLKEVENDYQKSIEEYKKEAKNASV